MKLKTHIVVTTIVLGHLALPVATTHAGGITPVPKLVAVTEAQAVLVEDSAGNSDVIYDDSARQTAGGQPGPGEGFRDLAINRLDANPNDFVGAKIYIADAGTDNDDGRILRLDITPNAPDTLTEMYVGLSFPNGIAFARHEVEGQDLDYLYWSDKVDMEICWISGTDIDCEVPNCPTQICVSTSPNPPGNVRVCSANDIRCGGIPETLYWTELTGSIKFTDAITPTTGAPLVTGLSDPVGLSIGKDKIYWTEMGKNGQIGRANLDGSDKQASFVVGVADSVGIGIGFHRSSTPQTMLWTLRTAEKIRMRAIGGGGKGSDFGDTDLGPVTGIRVLFPPGLIPTISTWGAVVMMLLVLAGGTIAIIRRRTAVS